MVIAMANIGWNDGSYALTMVLWAVNESQTCLLADDHGEHGWPGEPMSQIRTNPCAMVGVWWWLMVAGPGGSGRRPEMEDGFVFVDQVRSGKTQHSLADEFLLLRVVTNICTIIYDYYIIINSSCNCWLWLVLHDWTILNWFCSPWTFACVFRCKARYPNVRVHNRSTFGLKRGNLHSKVLGATSIACAMRLWGRIGKTGTFARIFTATQVWDSLSMLYLAWANQFLDSS